MPLETGDNKAAIAHNIKTEEAAGKPHDQAVAIALSTAKDEATLIDRPAAGCVYVAATNNRVLLLCRPDGTWGLPAGSIEDGESPEETARRETYEETGYTPLMPFRNIGQFDNLRAYTTRCEMFPVCLNDEHTGYGWFDVTGLPAPLHRECRSIIEAAMADGIAMDERERDINGWLEIDDNPIMAVGVYPYLGKNIKGAPDPNKFYMVYRPEEEVSDPECMASFRLMPWIDDHTMLGDGDKLTPVEAKPIEGVIGERIYYDPDDKKMKANLKIWTSTHEKRVFAEGKRELSLGYRCKFDATPGEYNGVRYDYVQRMMRGNHLASVDDGRSGPDIAVMDARDFNFITDSMEYQTMSKKTPVVMTPKVKRVAAVLAGLLQFAKDEADKPDVSEEKKGELAQLSELIEQAAPVIQAISEIGVVASGEAEEDIVVDEEDDDKEDKDGKKPDDKAMDAADVRKLIRSEIRTAFAGLQPVQDASDVIADIKRGATMAEQASRHIGTFETVMDGKDMTEQQVAEYVVDKAGITGVTKGQEIAAVKGWMAGRVAPMDRNLSFVQDARDVQKPGDKPAFLKNFESGKQS